MLLTNIFDRPGTPAHYCPDYLYDLIDGGYYRENSERWYESILTQTIIEITNNFGLWTKS